MLLQFTAGPDTVKEVERRLRVSDMVMKFITVRIDEKLKKIEKRKKARDKRAARRPAPPVPRPACLWANRRGRRPHARRAHAGAPTPAAPPGGARADARAQRHQPGNSTGRQEEEQ